MSASRAAGPLLALGLSLLQACGDYDEPLPPVHGQAWDRDCTPPLPPPPPPLGLEQAEITRGRDPAHCLPVDIRREGLLLAVELSPRGRPLDVAAPLDMCLESRHHDKPKPAFTLSPAVQECILEDLRSWRFAGASPCSSHGTFILLTEDGGKPSAAAALQAGGGCAG